MKYCYTDFAFTILDYFSVINGREFIFEWLMPLLMAIASYFIVQYNIGEQSVSVFLNNFLSILTNLFAILVGFTIATVAIFTTADASKIETLNKTSDREIRGKGIPWYRFIYVNLIYSAVAGIFMLILTLLSQLLTLVVKDEVIIAVLVMGALHSLLLSLRNITNLYFIFYEQKSR
jgi:hypothetical protein